MFTVQLTASVYGIATFKSLLVERLEDLAVSCEPGHRHQFGGAGESLGSAPALVWVVKAQGVEIYRAPFQPTLVVSLFCNASKPSNLAAYGITA